MQFWSSLLRERTIRSSPTHVEEPWKCREFGEDDDGVAHPVTTLLGKRQSSSVDSCDSGSSALGLHVGYRRRKLGHHRIDHSVFESFYRQKRFTGLHMDASTACKDIARLLREHNDSEDDAIALVIVRYLNNNAFLPHMHAIFDFFALERTVLRLESLFRLDIVKEFSGKLTEKFKCKN